MSFFKALLGICETKPLSSDLWGIEDGKISIKLSEVPELSNEGDAVYVKGPGLPNPVLILRDEDEKYLAFANRCTHGGRKIDPVPGERILRCCSLNHSTYDYDGNNIKGPAKEALTGYTVELSDGNLVITL